MKKVLLPTDFSKNAYNAIRYALRLFKDEECAFYLLHTYTPPIYHTDYILPSPAQIGLGDIYQTESMAQLEKVRGQIIKEFKNPKHSFITHATFNTLVDEVVRTTKNEKIDLVVMGTQGATGAKEILFGTHTVHVLKKSVCPVVVIPPNFEYEVPKEILFPTDYEVDYGEEQLKELFHIAKQHLARVNVLHVSRGYDLSELQLTSKNRIDGLLGAITHIFHDMPDQEIMEAINSFQLKTKINLLVMIQNKHTFLERLFISPVINQIGFHVTVPFMVIPHPEKN